jgi:hypothetical protein
MEDDGNPDGFVIIRLYDPDVARVTDTGNGLEPDDG